MKAVFEKIESNEARAFNVLSYEKPEFDVPFHYHPQYELTYIVESSGVRYTGNVFENFEQDDLVLLGPNLPHCWKNIGNVSGRAGAIVVHWNEELLGNGWTETNSFRQVKTLFHDAKRGLKFPKAFATALKQKLDTLVGLSGLPQLICLLEIFDELSSCSEGSLLCKDSFDSIIRFGNQERINTVYQYINNHYAEKITLRDVAEIVFMTEESFSRYFSKLMNKSFFSFLNEFRIGMACKFLIETNASVSEIAYRSGFNSLPFFFRQFSHFKGVTPNEFRRAYFLPLRLKEH